MEKCYTTQHVHCTICVALFVPAHVLGTPLLFISDWNILVHSHLLEFVAIVQVLLACSDLLSNLQ